MRARTMLLLATIHALALLVIGWHGVVAYQDVCAALEAERACHGIGAPPSKGVPLYALSWDEDAPWYDARKLVPGLEDM